MKIEKVELERLEQAFRAGMLYGYTVERKDIFNYEDRSWSKYSKRFEVIEENKED